MAKKLYLCDVSFIATVKLPIEADSEEQAAQLAEKRLEQIAILHDLSPRLVGTVRYAATWWQEPACDPDCDVTGVGISKTGSVISWEDFRLPGKELSQCANCDEWFYQSNHAGGELKSLGMCCCHHCFCQKNGDQCESGCKLCAP